MLGLPIKIKFQFMSQKTTERLLQERQHQRKLSKTYIWDFYNDKTSSILRNSDKHISYTRLIENVMEGFKEIPKVEFFGLHNLGASGCATAAGNLGVKRLAFQKNLAE